MGLFKNYVSQTRKPEGFLGKMMLSGMNSGHARMADWGFSHLPAITPTDAVDLGCGGGRNAGELLKKVSEGPCDSRRLFRAVRGEGAEERSGLRPQGLSADLAEGVSGAGPRRADFDVPGTVLPGSDPVPFRGMTAQEKPLLRKRLGSSTMWHLQIYFWP